MARKAKRRHGLTEAYVKRLQPESERYEVHDATRPGLVIRVTPAGAKSFAVRHRVHGGGLERVTIGRWPDVSVKDAQTAAKGLVGAFATGANPAADRRGLRDEASLGELWRLFLELHAKPRKRSWRTDENRWNLHLARFAGERLRTFTTARVTVLLAGITGTSGPGASNRTRSLLFTMFEKGRREWGLQIANPVRDVTRNAEHKKDRYLLPEEMRRFLHAVDADPDPDTRLWISMALFTGQRSGTLSRAKWADLNLTGAAWAIPPEDMKAGKPLLVALAAPLVTLLKARQKAALAGEAFVFPSRRPEAYMDAPRAGFARVLETAGLSGLTPHDLRRTFATWALDAGAPSIVLARLLGHSPAPGMVSTTVYAQVSLDVLRRWADKTVKNMLAVAAAADDGTVLQFPGAAGGAQ
jgi:integrase